MALPVAGAPDLDAFKYVGFEDRFRGSQHEIRERLTDYLPIFTGASHVLDIGCGRGELLDLFRGAGIGAHGIYTNQSMVQECRDRGLTAATAYAVATIGLALAACALGFWLSVSPAGR